MYKYLLIDADETLLDFKAAESKALSEALKKNGISATDHIISTYSAINDALWKRLEQGEITRPQLRLMRFQQLLQNCGIAADCAALAQDYVQLLAECGIPLSGAEELLTELKQKYRIAIITNGLSAVQRGRIAVSGLDKHIDALIISDEIGVSKPDVKIAEAALKALGCIDRREALIIGDSVTADIALGINAGIDTCLFGRSTADKAGATYTASDYDELRKLL